MCGCRTLELCVTSHHQWNEHEVLRNEWMFDLKFMSTATRNPIKLTPFPFDFYFCVWVLFVVTKNRHRHIWTSVFMPGPDKQQILRHENTDDGRCHSIETSGARQKWEKHIDGDTSSVYSEFVSTFFLLCAVGLYSVGRNQWKRMFCATRRRRRRPRPNNYFSFYMFAV